MALKIFQVVLCVALIDAFVLEHDKNKNFNISDGFRDPIPIEGESEDPNSAFNGVYSECFLHLSYTCLQKKTLLYLKQLDGLSEISIIGDYVKFVKLNNTEVRDNNDVEESKTKTSEELANMIDTAVEKFFNNHLILLSALGKDVLVPHTVEEFVGRKRRKGGGGGHGGGDGDGGKKKMMMMAMMCMKMKLMMMVPAMMGMMGMMSFKGMMFSMMSFMISKMMLLMKILEKKGGGASGGGGDGSWASGASGGAWMPAGGQDYGGGGGYDSNAQWSSRSILEKEPRETGPEKPIITYVKPNIRYNVNKKYFSSLKNMNDEVIKANNKIDEEPKSRRKRGLIDTLQNAYIYWTSKVLGLNYKQKHTAYPKYKIVNGVKYVYYPIRQIQKGKVPKELPIATGLKTLEESKPIVIAEDFNKGEIVEGVVESRVNRKKFHKMKDNVNETMDDNPWE